VPADPFGTEALRGRVLAGWAASSARFREDANAEEELVLGGYRDRLVVELAQNAADAAVRAGVPGRLRLSLRGTTLHAANTGAPLDAAGVEALSTLRASAKREEAGTTGRFGVGFAAVLAVSDAPEARSVTGAVRWSAGETRRLVTGLPGVTEEVQRRGGAVPVLRLPFAAPGEPPPGFATEVVLPLRDEAAGRLVAELLDGVDAALLVALPALAEVIIERDGSTSVLSAEVESDGVVVTRAEGGVTRWRVQRASGRADPALLRDRPVEERSRPGWFLTWAVPVDEAGTPRPLPPATAAVVHAPTPTDEPLGLPGLLVASLPLDPARRRTAPGALRDHILEEAAAAYARLVRDFGADDPDAAALALVPGPVPVGEVDAVLRRAVLARLRETAFLPAVASAEQGGRVRPSDGVALGDADQALLEVLAPVLPGLVGSYWAGSVGASLGVRRLDLADLVDQLAELRREPSWWSRLYEALGGADREALAGLPVPLADGRLVRGPRGLLLPADSLDLDATLALGLRVVHPDAAAPLLERLGAVPGTPAALLGDPRLRAVVDAAWDADDPAPVTAAVLSLVAAAGLRPGDQPWLADALALPEESGGWAAAGELLLPDGELAGVLEPGALGTVAAGVVLRHGADVVEAAGALRTFALVRDSDVVLDPETCDHDLDGEAGWVEQALLATGPGDVPPVVGELLAVRDLDLVAADRWPAALRLLAEPPLRQAVTRPVRVLAGDGSVVTVASYAAWWLGRHPVLGGRAPTQVRDPAGDPLLAGLYDDVGSLDLDRDFVLALGLRTTLGALLDSPGGPDELMARLADPERVVSPIQLTGVYAALGAVPPDRLEPPDRVRVVAGDGTRVTLASDALVVDAPDLLPLVRGRGVIPAPPRLAGALADLLDLDLASQVVPGAVTSEGTPVPVPPEVLLLLEAAPVAVFEHERLEADGLEVPWRVLGGTVHASTPDGLARGLAWAAGQWGRRFEVAEVLRDPSVAADLAAEAAFDER